MTMTASKKCCARPGLKRPAQVTVPQMQKKDLDMKRRQDLNGFSMQDGAKVVSGQFLLDLLVFCQT
jgi:hypothetical protein